MNTRHCDACHGQPARVYLRSRRAWMCGVCWHRLGVARDLAKRIQKARA